MPYEMETQEQVKRSRADSHDTFYNRPAYVQKFIDDVATKIPDDWSVKPWTINRAVTVFNSYGAVHHVYSYEAIEDGVEFVLRNDEMY